MIRSILFLVLFLLSCEQKSNTKLELQDNQSLSSGNQDFITGKIIDQVNSNNLKKYLLDKYFVNVEEINIKNNKCLSLSVNNNMQKNNLNFDAYYYCVTDILEKSFNNKFGKYKFLIVTGNYANLNKKVFDKHTYQGFFIPFLFKRNNNIDDNTKWDLIAKAEKDYFANDFGGPLLPDDCEIIKIGEDNYALSVQFEYINNGINEGWKDIIYSYNGVLQDLRLNTYFYDSNNEDPKIDLVFNISIDNDHKDMLMYPILLTIGGSYVKNKNKYNVNNKKILINFNVQQGKYLMPELSLYNDLKEFFLLNYDN